jgi:hypothetical protein
MSIKKYSILFFSAILVVIACKKEISLADGLYQQSEVCGDGEFNPFFGELALDCGGICEPCDFQAAPGCPEVSSSKVMNINGIEYSIDYSGTSTYSDEKALSGNLYYKFNEPDQRRVKINYYGKKTIPEAGKSYDIANVHSLSTKDSFLLEYSFEEEKYISMGGEIFMERLNGEMSYKFGFTGCEIPFKNSTSPFDTILISFSIKPN